MIDDFAIFICSYGRPDKQYTLQFLLNHNYTSAWYIVLDDTDSTIQEYVDIWGAEHIFVFDKNHYINTCDVGSNNPKYSCIVYAKNAVEDIAKSLDLKSFVIADDDIKNFRFRWIDDNNSCRSQKVDNHIEAVISAYNDYLLNTNLTALGFGIPRMYFTADLSPDRIPYNFVFRNASLCVIWRSWYGEDIITAIQNSKSQVWLTNVSVQQDIGDVGKGTNLGGMSEIYNNISDFKLAFQDVLYHPTSIKIRWYKNKFIPSILKHRSFPMIVSSDYRKER